MFKKIKHKIAAGLATIEAIGAVKRKGIGALKGRRGKVSGHGRVIHKDGSVTEINIGERETAQ